MVNGNVSDVFKNKPVENSKTVMTDRGVVVEWEENVTLFTQFTHEAFGLAFLMVQRQRELRQKKTLAQWHTRTELN